MKKTLAFAFACGLATMSQLPLAEQTPAAAQDYSAMSCSQLWFARNRIYADNGYCFKTARARRQFGAGCFPPYGRLTGYDKRRVDEIQYWEAQNGCR